MSNQEERQCDIANKYAVFVKQSSVRGLIIDGAPGRSTHKTSANIVADVVLQTASQIKETCGMALCSVTPSRPPPSSLHLPHPSKVCCLSNDGRSSARQTHQLSDRRPTFEKYGSFRKILHRLEGMFVEPLPALVQDPLSMDISQMSPHTKATMIIENEEEFRYLMMSLRDRTAATTTNMGVKQALLAGILDEHVERIKEKSRSKSRSKGQTHLSLQQPTELHSLGVPTEGHINRELFVDFSEGDFERSETEEEEDIPLYRMLKASQGPRMERGRLRDIEQYPSLRLLVE
jgi:hypothetical protein